ncbi:hypothetical protein FGG08_004280 [Glutinoglossum americanum]|uniref:C2H2-type domain-containing protein n=1 Tax=Glutinoglossum americanum TaxID=1670608 RepID=A0A9P8L2W1_9PEZI|nr:hypothetical protein FGG08_004280 [Glutinoglossum americanum]
MSEIGEILCDKKKGLFSWADPKSSDAKLETQRMEVEFLIGSFRGDSDDPPESLDGSDDFSDLSGSGDPLGDIIEELRTYIRSLIDLAPCLERPAPDASTKELEAGPIVSSTVSGPAEIWCRRVIDRYEGIDIGLAKRLGEANWWRFQRVTQRLENAKGGNPDDSSDEGYLKSEEDAIPELPVIPKGAQDQDSGLGTTVAATSLPEAIYSFRTFPKTARADTASQATYTSALSEDPGESDWLQVPPLPEGATLRGSFRCTVCGDKLKNVKSRVDWKYDPLCTFIPINFWLTRCRRHVFTDLEPYICTFQDCTGGISTYSSRKLWADHEFSQHRIKKTWACSDCPRVFSDSGHFQRQINETHGNVYRYARLEALIVAAEKRIPHTYEASICNACRKAHGGDSAGRTSPRAGDGDENGSGSSNQSHSAEIKEAEETCGPEAPLVDTWPGTPNLDFHNPRLLTNSPYEDLSIGGRRLAQDLDRTILSFLEIIDTTDFPECLYFHLEFHPIPMASKDPEAQLAWAEEALVYVDASITYNRRTADDPTVLKLTQVDNQLHKGALTIVYTLACEGHPKAEVLRGLGLEYAKYGLKKDEMEAFECYQRAGLKGYGRAKFRMGMIYEKRKELPNAIGHYQEGVRLEDPASRERLGMMNLLGQHGQKQDYQLGVQLIAFAAQSANTGAPQGAYTYGLLLSRELPGVGVPESVLKPDVALAKEHFKRAALLGMSSAQVRMGKAYERSELGCDFDPRLAIHYNRLAARQGHVEAEAALSRWFLSGHEGLLARNDRAAFDYAMRAARDRYPPAEFQIGHFYEVGIHVKVDLESARLWYVNAAKHGNQDAAGRLESLNERLAKAGGLETGLP